MQYPLFATSLSPLQRADQQRQAGGVYGASETRAALGQYATPLAVARLMAGLLDIRSGDSIALLDPGIGMGALSLAALERVPMAGTPIQVFGYEVDQTAAKCARQNLYEATLLGQDVAFEVMHEDYLSSPLRLSVYSHAILNPPYKKLPSRDPRQEALWKLGIQAPNLYVAFVWKALLELSEGGQLVAIVPRSFANGSYYKYFRQYVKRLTHVERVLLFEQRDKVFADDGVLQESIILVLRKRSDQTSIRGHTCLQWLHGARLQVTDSRVVESGDLWWEPDGACLLRFPNGELEALPTGNLRQLDIQVSTGPVVDFRSAEALCRGNEADAFPLLRPRHFSKGRCTWPYALSQRAGGIRKTVETAKFFWPVGHYVVVRRISSKEEPRRVVASLVKPADFSVEEICFENHLNVFHDKRGGMDADLALGLCEYLNSETVDIFLRSISGHTQVNAGDLRTLPYPGREELVALGKIANRQ